MEKRIGNLEIFRIKKEKNFVVIDKNLINNSSISWKAKGILIYLLSKPNDWVLIISDIINHSTDGRDAVYSGIKELEKAGYVEKILERDKNNHFLGYVYFVFEKPQK